MAGKHTFTYTTFIPHPRERVFEWFQRPGAIQRLTPALFSRIVAEPSDGLHPGSKATLRMKFLGPLRGLGSLKWVAQHSELNVPSRFVDIQKHGPLRHWQHVHDFHSVEGGTRMVDTVTYKVLPVVPDFSLLTSLVDKKLKQLFAYRARQVMSDLDFHNRHPQHVTIGITGAGGLVGAQLTAFLQSGGHTVLALPRPNERIDMDLLRRCDAVVHLAGEPILGRFTDAHKRKVLESRVEGTYNLARAMATIAYEIDQPTSNNLPHVSHPNAHTPGVTAQQKSASATSNSPNGGAPLRKPTLISASAAGYYGPDRGDTVLSEDDTAGQGFLAEVCEAWEAACEPARDAGIRVVNVRTGIVQSAAGGQLGTLLPLFELGAGGRISNGKQWVAWIGLDDLVRLYAFAIFQEDVSGAINAVAPVPVRNVDYTKILGRVIGRPTVFPVPCFAPALLLGREGAKEFACAGQRLDASKIIDAGFNFTYPQVEAALRHELCGG